MKEINMHSKLVPSHIINAINDILLQENSTPFYLYDELGIKNNAENFFNVFNSSFKFKEFFAVKALPNPHILKIIKDLGFGLDCSSMAELILAEKCGFSGDKIFFTSNNTPITDYAKALELNAIINFDDINHIEFLKNNLYLPKLLSFRYNPGELKYANSIIGNPNDSKFGITKEQLFEAYKLSIKYGVDKFGLHVMNISNELNPNCFTENAKNVFELASYIMHKLNISLEFINLGGGMGIPYKPSETKLNISYIHHEINKLYQSYFPNKKPYIAMENGRYITGPYGYLVSKVLHLKNSYKNYVGIDANMANLMRPGMYGAYHHISILNKDNNYNNLNSQIYDIVGSLCENNDKFAINRKLPEINIGDIIIIHDTGAHCHSMGFNYNGKLRSSEYLLKQDGTIQKIRRAETLDDYFATIIR